MRYALMLISLFCFRAAMAQDTSYFYTDEVRTYDLMVQQQWKALVSASKQAIHQGRDYPLMRMRAAYGYYMQAKYFQAAQQYRKALHGLTDPSEAYLRNDIDECLYYSYLFTGQYPMALRTGSRLDDARKTAADMQSPPRLYFYNFEAGIKSSDHEELYQTLHYYQAGFGFRTGRSLSFYNALSYLQQHTYYGTMQQQQYYLAGTLATRSGWLLSPAVHVLHYSYSEVPAYLDAASLEAWPLTGSFQASKIFGKWGLSLSAGAGNLAHSMHYQEQGSLAYYPFGNSRLNITASCILLNNPGEALRPLPSLSSSWNIGRHLLLAGSFLYANTSNFMEQNGYIVNNSFDKTISRSTASVEWRFDKGRWNFNNMVSAFVVAQNEPKTESYYGQSYRYHTLVAGIKLIP